ncbi:MAG: hypothetical protein HUU50_04575 [Candidatus Brocadiae bacterium]|nr:hypothetical protein [Candidatus Brocadiia bacterium]
MKKIFSLYNRLFYFYLFFSFFASGMAQSWQESSAPCRIKIKKSSGPWPCHVGYVEIYPGFEDTKGFRLYRNNATEVAYKILWSKKGEPIKILFDCSSKDKEYYLYCMPKATPGRAGWEPKAGLFLWTKKRPEGAVDNLAQVKELWQRSEETFGASRVPMVFHGVHLHGDSLNFLSYYLGYLEIPKEGTYSFATVSDDASFLLINGKEVAAWPGWHGPHQGLHGEYSGDISLASGIHKLEYYHVQGLGGTTAVAAWRQPSEKRWRLIQPQSFLPVASFTCAFAETAVGKKQKTFFAWQTTRHLMAEKNIALVEMLFQIPDPIPQHRYVWTIDDGSKKEGEKISHVFLRPAMRMIQLEVWQGSQKLDSVWQKIHVQPKWEQINLWDDHVFLDYTKQILEQNLMKIPMEDFLYLIQFACSVKAIKWLDTLSATSLLRAKEYKKEHADTLYALALACQEAAISQIHNTKQILELILALPAEERLSHQARLHLGDFLYFIEGKAQDAHKIIQGISPSYLSLEERGKLKILQAEILFAENQVEKAKETLFSFFTPPTSSSFSLQRAGILEKARLLLIQKKIQDASEILKEWQDKNPTERLYPDTLFVDLKVALANQEYARALLLCQKLSQLVSLDKERAWVLYYLMETHKKAGNLKESQEAMQKLLKDFRYTEPAAMAKEKNS